MQTPVRSLVSDLADATMGLPPRGSRQKSTADIRHAESREMVSTAVTTEAVYVTRTGEKYHRGSCRHLSRNKIPISLADAKRSYGACKVCRPPR